MLQGGERLRIELMKKATQGELKAILEFCLNMNEGNLSLRKTKSHCSVVSTLANRDIPLSNKKRWMLSLVSIKRQTPRQRHKNKAIIRLSSHPSR